jgi:hypothetical protein
MKRVTIVMTMTDESARRAEDYRNIRMRPLGGVELYPESVESVTTEDAPMVWGIRTFDRSNIYEQVTETMFDTMQTMREAALGALAAGVLVELIMPEGTEI